MIDDGVGIDGHVADGVGLTAMRERAAELGGVRPRSSPTSPRGTHVHVQLTGGVAVKPLRRWRSSTTTRCSGWASPWRSARWKASSSSVKPTTRAQVETLVASTAPDLVLLDVRLGDASGLEVNRWLAEHHPAVKVIMLTMSEDHDTALTALRDGARGYLVKGAGPERVEHALRVAAAGDVVLDHDLAQAVSELARMRNRPSSRPFPELTDARVRHPRARRRRARQSRHREAPRAKPEDGAQSCLQRDDEDPRRRSATRDSAGPTAGAR